MGRILKAIWNRQVAKHGSVAALAIGALASALGIPLAPEQISLLLTAFSVVMYVLSQIRALWRPDPKPTETTVRFPTGAKVLLAAFLVGELLHAAPARADSYAFTVLHPTEYTDNGGPSTPIPAAWTIYTAIDCGPSAQPSSDWSYVVTVVSPSSSVTADVPAGFYCAAHSTFTAKGEGAFSAFSSVLQLPGASSPPPATTPTLTASPGAPGLSVARQ